MKRAASVLFLASLLATACDAGIPVTLKLDEFDFEIDIDESIEGLSNDLRSTGILPPESVDLPELWPAELPDVCYDFLVSTDPKDGGQIDLTPDPAVNPDLAETFQPVNDGLVDRIEIELIVVRVEENSINIPLPTVEIQAADAIDADPDDRRAWRTIGTLGGDSLSPGCPRPGAAPDETDANEGIAVMPQEIKDLEFKFHRSGESFLDNQLADEDCIMRQLDQGGPANMLACKEFALRARSRVRLDTSVTREKPRGRAKLRLILVGTFFVTPI